MSNKTHDVTLRMEHYDDGRIHLTLTNDTQGITEEAEFNASYDPRLNINMLLLLKRLDQYSWKVTSSERG